MPKSYYLFPATALLALAIFLSPASAGDDSTNYVSRGVYATDGKNLYLINPESAESQLIGPHELELTFSPDDELMALEFTPDGTLYALMGDGYPTLYTIDPSTGKSTWVARLMVGLPMVEGGLVIHDGQMYISYLSRLGRQIIMTVDMSFDGTIAHWDGFDDRRIVAMDSSNDTLYAVDADSDTWGYIDFVNQSYVQIEELSFDLVGDAGLSVSDGFVMLTDAATGSVYQLFANAPGSQLIGNASSGFRGVDQAPAVEEFVFLPLINK